MTKQLSLAAAHAPGHPSRQLANQSLRTTFRFWRTIAWIALCAFTGCHFGNREKKSEVANHGPTLLASQIHSPLPCAFAIDEVNDEVPFTLHDCIFESLTHFRHPLGLHAVQRDASFTNIVLTMPPALDRLEQVQFSRDLQSHLVEVLHTYWQFVAAVECEQLQGELTELHEHLVAIEETKLQFSSVSLLELNRSKLQAFDQSISALSRYLPNHDAGDSQMHLRQLLTYCGQDYRCNKAYLPQTVIDDMTPIDYCLNCSIERSLSHNPDLLLQRAKWFTVPNTQVANPNPARPFRRGKKEKIENVRLPNTFYDIACQEQQKIELATNQLWEQIRAGRQAYDLINEELSLLMESEAKMDEAIATQAATLQDKVLLQISIHQTALRGVILAKQLGMATNQLLYQAGMLCDVYQIDCVNYWLTAENGSQHCHGWGAQ